MLASDTVKVAQRQIDSCHFSQLCFNNRRTAYFAMHLYLPERKMQSLSFTSLPWQLAGNGKRFPHCYYPLSSNFQFTYTCPLFIDLYQHTKGLSRSASSFRKATLSWRLCNPRKINSRFIETWKENFSIFMPTVTRKFLLSVQHDTWLFNVRSVLYQEAALTHISPGVKFSAHYCGWENLLN